ncbi:MAG TPA: hypothetical protein VHZ32_14370 [Rhizomicrobium sp.]|nr:hypothetical protein [Rhizomicrobium sp.]
MKVQLSGDTGADTLIVVLPVPAKMADWPLEAGTVLGVQLAAVL